MRWFACDAGSNTPAASAPGVPKSSSIAARNAATTSRVALGVEASMPAARARRRSASRRSTAALAAEQLRVTELHGAPVVRLERGQSERARAVRVEGVVQRREVPERLRHLLATDLDHAGVDPMASERVPGRLRLCPLVLVVREHEVVARPVQVESLPQLPQ